jgi:ribosome-binding factor A
VRIDDERLTFVTVTDIDVDPELNRAIVFYDSLADEEGDEEILEAFADHRIRLQSSIARQIRAKKTPILAFRPDMVIRSAARIDDILKSDQARLEREANGDDPTGDDPTGDDSTPDEPTPDEPTEV